MTMSNLETGSLRCRDAVVGGEQEATGNGETAEAFYVGSVLKSVWDFSYHTHPSYC